MSKSPNSSNGRGSITPDAVVAQLLEAARLRTARVRTHVLEAPDYGPNEAQKYRITPGWAPLLSTPGAKRWLARDRRSRGGAVLPVGDGVAVHSLSPRVLRMTEELVRAFERELPVSGAHSGLAGPNAVAGTIQSCLCVSQYDMRPRPTPLMSNQKLLAKQGLGGVTGPVSAAHEEILTNLLDLFFDYRLDSSVHIRAQASTSFPFFTTRPEYKLECILRILQNLDDFFACIRQRNFARLASEYGVVIVYAIHKRTQPNQVTGEPGNYVAKPRLGPTPEESRAGEEGSNADLRVELPDGSFLEGHFAARARDVWGMNGPANYILSCGWQPLIDAFKARYPLTYKCTTDELKTTFFRSWRSFRGSDVKTMDKLTMKWFMKRLLDRARTVLPEELCTLADWVLFAPFVSPWTGARPIVPDTDPCFGSPPFSEAAFNLEPGLTSGNALNVPIGVLWMTFVYLCAAHDAGLMGFGRADIDEFLLHKNPRAALVDSSDDAVGGARNDDDVMAWLGSGSPYAVLELEEICQYLGSVGYRDGSAVYSGPNIISYFTNLLVTEQNPIAKGMGSWAAGFRARELIYSRAPAYATGARLLREATTKHLGVDIHGLAERFFPGNAAIGDADAAFLLNPDYIHYKIDPTLVHPALLESVFTSVPHSLIESTLGKRINPSCKLVTKEHFND